MSAKETPKGFSEFLRDLRRADRKSGVLAEIPKNKRPFYQRVIEDFEKKGSTWGPSGMSVNIVACWLKSRGEGFTIKYQPGFGFTIARTR